VTIYHGSRYEYEPLDRVVDGDGAQNLTIFARSLQAKYNSAPFRFSQHVLVEGERLESLAYLAYGTPQLWWLIADANPEIFHPEDDLVPGTIIRIPVYRPLRRLLLPAGGNIGGIQFLSGGFSGSTLR
jgi:hypothetical protein